MKVEHWNTQKDGILTEGALRAKLEQLGYRVSRYTYPPGTYFATHTHAVHKIDAVVSGQLRIVMGKDTVALKPGDWIHVPSGVEHSAEVSGDEAVVSLDAVRVR